MGTVTAIGYVSVSFRLVGVERGEVRLAEKVDEHESFRQDFSEGVEAAGIQALPKRTPIPTEVLNGVTQRVVGRLVERVNRHFENRAEQFLAAARELEGRRQFTRAVEEYMNCITSAELENRGGELARIAHARIEQLLQQ